MNSIQPFSPEQFSPEKRKYAMFYFIFSVGGWGMAVISSFPGVRVGTSFGKIILSDTKHYM